MARSAARYFGAFARHSSDSSPTNQPAGDWLAGEFGAQAWKAIIRSARHKNHCLSHKKLACVAAIACFPLVWLDCLLAVYQLPFLSSEIICIHHGRSSFSLGTPPMSRQEQELRHAHLGGRRLARRRRPTHHDVDVGQRNLTTAQT